MTDHNSKMRLIISLNDLVAKGYLALVEEIASLKKQRDIYFGGNMKKLLKIAPSMVVAYDQMIRDKHIVARRYQIFGQDLVGLEESNMTDSDENNFRLTAMSIAVHSQAISECCDGICAELESLKDSLSGMKNVLESFGESEDVSSDISDTLDNDEPNDEFGLGETEAPF